MLGIPMFLGNEYRAPGVILVSVNCTGFSTQDTGGACFPALSPHETAETSRFAYLVVVDRGVP